MSISITNITCSNNHKSPSFGSNPNKVFTFIKNNSVHLINQSVLWTSTELIEPTTSIKTTLIRKVLVDFLEVTLQNHSKNASDFSHKKNILNVFAYLEDGLKAMQKKFRK